MAGEFKNTALDQAQHTMLAEFAYQDVHKAPDNLNWDGSDWYVLKDNVRVNVVIQEHPDNINNPKEYFYIVGAQAEYISNRYEIVGYETNAAGYYGVLLKERGTQHYVLANRGTEATKLTDVATDIILGGLGVSPQDSGARSLYGKIPPGDDITITMTGHSLGGYLTTVLFSLNQDDPRLLHGYSINGAGDNNFLFSGSIINAVRQHILGFDDPLSVDPDASYTNIRTDEGPDVVASLGFYLGEFLQVNTDFSSSVTAASHSSTDLAQAMLVRAIVLQSNPDMTSEQYNQLVETMSLGASSDIDRMLYTMAVLNEHPDADLLLDNLGDRLNQKQQKVAYELLDDVDNKSLITPFVVEVSDVLGNALVKQVQATGINTSLLLHAVFNGLDLVYQIPDKGTSKFTQERIEKLYGPDDELTYKTSAELKKVFDSDGNEISSEIVNVVVIATDEDGNESRYFSATQTREFKVGSTIITADSDGVTDVRISLGDGKYQSIDVGQIGSILGSNVSKLFVTDNKYFQPLGNALFSAIGDNLADSIVVTNKFNETVMGEKVDLTVWGNFEDDLKIAVKGQITGLMSSYLTQELVAGLGIDTRNLSGQLANEIVSFYVSDAVTGVIGAISSSVSAGETVQQSVEAGEAAANTAEASSGLQFKNMFGSFVGKKLGEQVYEVKSKEGAIGAEAGAAIGAKIGAATPLGPIGAAIGAFIGYIIGGLFGDLFGGTPEAAADVVFDPETGEFYVTNVWHKHDGSESTARQLATYATDSLNSIVAAVGGDVINDGRLYGGTYGMRKSDLTYRPEGRHSQRREFGDAGELINYGVVHALADLDIAGGDLYTKRAVYLSLEQLLSSNDGISDDALYIIAGNISLASEYAFYSEQSDAINTLIALQPDTAFSAGWMITLEQVAELGLNRRHEADHFGGWQYLIENENPIVVDTPEGRVETYLYNNVNLKFKNNERTRR